MGSSEDGFPLAAALHAVEGSDPRWRRRGSGGDDPRFDSGELERLARGISSVVDDRPAWTETVVLPGADGGGETEVRVLTDRALIVASVPWSAADPHPEPLLTVRPLRLLRELDVDGFEQDPAGRPTGCTVTLRFSSGSSVRLGEGDGADRTELARLLPRLLLALGA